MFTQFLMLVAIDMIDDMDTGTVNVEEYYRQAVNAMTPAQKFARTVELNRWAHWNIERCITEDEGPLPPEVMKWRVALWLYGRNPDCRQLIEEQLARVQSG